MMKAVEHSLHTLGQRIRFAREAAGLTQEDVAKHFEIRRVSVTQWEADVTKPSIERLPELARFMRTTQDWLLEARGEMPNRRAGHKKERLPRTTAIDGGELVGAKDLPIFAAAMGGDGHIIVSFDAIDYVKRPAALQNVRGGYGLLVKGESMVPAYREGDTALVNPHLPPARDTDAIFYHVPPQESGEAEAIIKRLIGFNDREWKLEQYRPEKTFTESRADWPICHRVVGRYNSR